MPSAGGINSIWFGQKEFDEVSRLPASNLSDTGKLCSSHRQMVPILDCLTWTWLFVLRRSTKFGKSLKLMRHFCVVPPATPTASDRAINYSKDSPESNKLNKYICICTYSTYRKLKKEQTTAFCKKGLNCMIPYKNI